MKRILVGSQRTPELGTWWDPSQRRGAGHSWAVPPGCSSAWNRAQVGWRTCFISVPAGFQPGHCFLVLPRDLVPCQEVAQPHLLGVPPLPSFQCQSQCSQLTCRVLCTMEPCPCALFPITGAASPPSPAPAHGMKPPQAKGASHPSQPHTAPPSSPAFLQDPKTGARRGM